MRGSIHKYKRKRRPPRGAWRAIVVAALALLLVSVAQPGTTGARGFVRGVAFGVGVALILVGVALGVWRRWQG